MALDLAHVARRAAEFGGEEAIASVSLRRELVIECGPSGALRPPRRSFELLVRLLVRDGGGRFGMACCTATSSDAGLALLAERARAQASRGPRDLRPLPVPEPGPVHQGFDAATARLDPERAEQAARAAANAIGLELGRGRSARWRSEHVELAVVRSGGDCAQDERTAAQLQIRATDDEGVLTGYEETASPAAAVLEALMPGAGATPLHAPTAAPAGPVVLRGTDHAVVLEPAALAPLLEAFARQACTGTAHATGTSPHTGRRGEPVASPQLTLTDEAQFTYSLGRAIDVEGAPAETVALLEDGCAASVLHDSVSAAAFAGVSTGHGAELGGAPRGAAARNLVLESSLQPWTALELAGGCDAPVVLVGMIEQVTLASPVSTRFQATGRAATLLDGGAAVELLGEIVLTGDLASLTASVDAVGGRPSLIARLDRDPARTSATWCPAVLAHGVDVVVLPTRRA